MKTIAYTGTADYQGFSKADLEKAGVELGKKDIMFARAKPTEVDDEVAEALLSKDNIFGNHQFTDLTEVGDEDELEGEQEQEQLEVAQKAAAKTAKKAASSGDAASGTPTSGKKAKTQSPATDTGTAATTSTGAGSST